MILFRAIRYLPPLLWTALIAWLSLSPEPPVPRHELLDRIHADKWLHALLYAVLFLLYALSFRKGKSPVRVIAMSCAIAVFTGIVMEMLQWHPASGRHFDMLDIMANIIGVLLASALYIQAMRPR